eukprot:182108_1
MVNGGQMGSEAWAAYDIIFWLHPYCNVDRIYESYLHMELMEDTHKMSICFGAEFEAFKKANNVYDIQRKGYLLIREALGYINTIDWMKQYHEFDLVFVDKRYEEEWI